MSTRKYATGYEKLKKKKKLIEPKKGSMDILKKTHQFDRQKQRNCEGRKRFTANDNSPTLILGIQTKTTHRTTL